VGTSSPTLSELTYVKEVGEGQPNTRLKEVLKLDGGCIAGVFALSSAICCHLISRRHYGVTRSWIVNKWFWAGFFGSLPALVAFVAHVYLSRGRSD